MELHSGNDRHVIVGKKRTIKIARSNPGDFIDQVKDTYTRYGFKNLINSWRNVGFDGYTGLKWQLFHGITANRREYRLALKSDLVVPTRMLLAGIINVQPTTTDVNIETGDVLSQLVDSLEQPGMNIPRLGHMLEDTGNFGVHGGSLKFRDGGSYGLERVLNETAEEPNIKHALGALMLKQVD